MLAINVDKRSASDIRHAGTTKDILDLTRANGHSGATFCVALIAAAILALLAATAFAVPPVREAIIRTWITWTGRSAD